MLLPELYSSGFAFDSSMWATAERLDDGPTRTWLCAQARRLRLHVGSSFLEAAGAHFFNTFVLAGPDGQVAGVVRKQTPAALEAFFFAPGAPRGAEAHLIVCPALGGLRLLVGICYENALAYLARYAVEARADLLLMPHSCPPIEHVPQPVADAFAATVAALPRRYAQALGIPVVFCNKSGPFSASLLGVPSFSLRAPFLGLSSIVDADGSQLAPPCAAENCVVLGTVRIPPPGACCRSAFAAAQPAAARWYRKHSPLAPYPALIRATFAVDEAVGGLWYRCSRTRRRLALQASGLPADWVAVPPLLSAQVHPALTTMVLGGAAVLALALGRAALRGALWGARAHAPQL